MADNQELPKISQVPIEPMPFLVRRRTVFTWFIPLLLIIGVIARHADEGKIYSCIAGILFVILGEFVRFWAAGYISKDETVTVGGPYAYVRNPLYFGTLLLAIGYGLVSGLGWIGVLVMVASYFVFHLAAISYEEKFLKAKFGQAYLDYLQRVPALIPSITPRTRGEGSYSWKQALHNREHTSAIFAVILIAILLCCRYISIR